MKVSSYNVGRTPADVSDKTWVDGTRFHLRPDTMWADGRYATITQTEVNEAKKRHDAREAAKAKHHAKDSHAHHDKHDKHGDKHHGGKHGKVDHTKLPLATSLDSHGHYDFKHASIKQKRDLYPWWNKKLYIMLHDVCYGTYFLENKRLF